jgi:hypothetical protein
MWVLPTPTGPNGITDSPACSQRSADRSRICAAGNLEEAAKSNSSACRAARTSSGPQAALENDGLPAGDLVLTRHLQELQVPELAAVGLEQPGVQGVQHAGQSQDLQ